MSATLTWFHSGLGTKTGTTSAALIDDLVALINSKSGVSDFSWQVASSNSASSPYYIVLKRKDASAGRILLVIWTSAPAGNNPAILDQAPSTGYLYGAYFPAGNVDTPSNLTASSGTILGNDSNALKVWIGMNVNSVYTTDYKPFYFDSAEALVLGFQNPSVSTCYWAGAGALVVDSADNAYDAVFSNGHGGCNSFGTSGGFPAWTSQTCPAGQTAGTGQECMRSNYGANNRRYFAAWSATGSWAGIAVGATDVLSDTSNSKAWFAPFQLLGQTKGEGFVLKLRQIAFGPGATTAFSAYSTSGPVLSARQFNAATAGGNGYPWFTNFKL